MSGMYVKLFSDILDSSLWHEPHATRIVWVTMLVMADEEGLVRVSLPGLAARARVTLEEADAALRKFESPDPYSRTSTNEGRRVTCVDGGYQINNYLMYREIQTQRQRREYMRTYMANYRKQEKANSKHHVSSGKQTETPVSKVSRQADTDTEAETREISCSPKSGDRFGEWYRFYPKKVAKGSAEKAWRKLTPDQKAKAMEVAPLFANATKGAQPQFIPYPASFLNASRFDDDPATWALIGRDKGDVPPPPDEASARRQAKQEKEAAKFNADLAKAQRRLKIWDETGELPPEDADV